MAQRTKKRYNDLFEVSVLVNRLLRKIDASDGDAIEHYLTAAGISISGLAKFYELTNQAGESIQQAPIMRSSKGGKNWAAYDIAQGVAQLFFRLDRRITFGHQDGEPTTEFGRSVQISIKAFALKANWREPARYAAKNTEFWPEF